MDKFKELLEKLDSDIAQLSDEELTEARAEIKAYGRELKNVETETDEDEAQLTADAEALAAAMKTIDETLEARATAAAEAAAAREEAFAAFEDDDSEDADETDDSPSEDIGDSPTEEPVEEVVAAAPALSEIAKRRPRNAPKPEPKKEPEVIVAAAVGDEKLGSRFDDSDALAQAMFDAYRHGPRSGRQTVARIPLESNFELTASPEDNWAILNDVQRGVQKAYQDWDGKGPKPLVAAGYCAPAEPRYEFLQQGSREGILQLPSVTARRGRLTYPPIYNVRDLQVQDGIGFQYTDQMDQDAVEKPCYTVPCVDGVTFGVDAASTCLVFSNFDQQFWPERVTHVTGQSMLAHDHEVNLQQITAIVADGRTETVIDGHTNGGTWVQLIQSLALHGGFIRNRLRLPLSTVLEAAIPSLVLDALVADQVARDSSTQYAMVQAEVEAALRRAKINVQWVYDWQEPGHPNWPADYDYLLWPAGTIVELNGGSLDLGVTRDSTLNVANDFQIFSETFQGIAIIGSGVYNVTGVELCPNGETGNRAAISCAAGS